MPNFVPIFGHGTKPALTGSAFLVPERVVFPSSLTDGVIWQMNDTVVNPSIFGRFRVPADYLTSMVASLTLEWTSVTTTGNAGWKFQYTAVGGTNVEVLSSASFQNSSLVQTAAPGASGRKITSTLTLTASDFLANDTVLFSMERDSSNVLDTLAATIYLYDAVFGYV